MRRGRPGLSLFGSLGPVSRRCTRLAAVRVDSLAHVATETLLDRYGGGHVEVLTDGRGRAHEVETDARRDGSDLVVAVTVTDVPDRRARVGDGFRRGSDGTLLGRSALLYFE